MYYKAKVKCRIENDESGKIQKVTDEFLVYAVSITDVDAIIAEEYRNSTFDWELVAVSETKVEKVLGIELGIKA